MEHRQHSSNFRPRPCKTMQNQTRVQTALTLMRYAPLETKNLR